MPLMLKKEGDVRFQKLRISKDLDEMLLTIK